MTNKRDLATNFRTKMASGKKRSDDAANRLATDPTGDHVGAGYAEIDDIPDRLLIVANRLQKALDSRRVVANAQRPSFKENRGDQ